MVARIAACLAFRIAACLALAATAAALDRVEVSIETRIAAPRVDASALAAGSLEAALEELARVQRFRDDLVSGDAATPLGGYTVEVVAKSSEYEARAGDDRGEGRRRRDRRLGGRRAHGAAAPRAALPRGAPGEAEPPALKAWLKLASDFPAFRGSLAGPMPRNVSADLEAWAPPRLERLWVAGVDVPVRAEGAHGLVRDALRAVEDHARSRARGPGRRVRRSPGARPAPTAVGGLGALDDARHSSVVYDSGADEDADFADDDAAVARLFFDPSSKRELEVALRVLDVYMDVDMKQTGASRRTVEGARAAGGLDGGAVRKAFKAALDAKARGRADALFDAAEAAAVPGAPPVSVSALALAVVANGRVTFLADDEGLMDHEQARRAVGAAVERAHAAPGGAPFFSRTLTPLAEGSDLRKWSQTSMWGEPVVFDTIVTAGGVRVEPKTPSWWRLRLVEAAGGDVDNLAPAEVAGAVTARYAVDAVYVRGQARNTIRASIGASFANRLEAARCVAVNGGASQVVEANGEFTVAVSDFNATPRWAPRTESCRAVAAPKPLKHRRDYFSACNRSTSRDGTVHVFSVASGQTYERLLRIMMGSAALATSRPLKFWLLAEFLSPAFDAPALAAALGADIELLDSPPWPEP
ncbi:hypothetical protein JL720_3143 [Aureococcus anophagefferens]|nr:hypothetical protein JL720_3143 [Aureococcus anophagefferens]